MNQLQSKNDRSRIEYEDDLRLTFGTKSKFEELYINGNNVKLNVSLFTKRGADIKKEIEVIAGYSSTIKEVCIW